MPPRPPLLCRTIAMAFVACARVLVGSAAFDAKTAVSAAAIPPSVGGGVTTVITLGVSTQRVGPLVTMTPQKAVIPACVFAAAKLPTGTPVTLTPAKYVAQALVKFVIAVASTGVGTIANRPEAKTELTRAISQ